MEKGAAAGTRSTASTVQFQIMARMSEERDAMGGDGSLFIFKCAPAQLLQVFTIWSAFPSLFVLQLAVSSCSFFFKGTYLT